MHCFCPENVDDFYDKTILHWLFLCDVIHRRKYGFEYEFCLLYFEIREKKQILIIGNRFIVF